MQAGGGARDYSRFLCLAVPDEAKRRPEIPLYLIEFDTQYNSNRMIRTTRNGFQKIYRENPSMTRPPASMPFPLAHGLRVAACCTVFIAAVLHTTGIAYAEGAFSVSSATFKDGGRVASAQVFDQNGCDGGNRSPQLTWRDAPKGTRSFAITMFDPDAPGRGWWHWAVANLPARVTALPENASASGALAKLGAIEAHNDFNTGGYGGPCPPPGKPHRYVITVYALGIDKLVGLDSGRPAAMFDHEIGAAALGSTQLTVTYGR
jgi:Raf kinase inhibitor-like YbhB/YbcL family protein